MTPQEYIGTDPYGNSAKMSKIVVSETSYLPLATIKETSKYILYMWMFSNADKTVTLYYGNERKTFNLTTSWQQFGFQFESSVNDNISLELPSGIYYIWHPKLEKGNKQTDWTQAPEDVEAEIDNSIIELSMLGWSVPKECPIQNEVNGNQFIQKVGRVNVGNLSWEYIQSFTAFRFSSLNKEYLNYGIKQHTILYLYGFNYIGSLDRWSSIKEADEKSIAGVWAGGADDGFIIKSTIYTDTASFKQAMQGQYLYYELATPITTTIDGNEIGETVSDVRKETTVNLLKPTLGTTTENGVTCTNNGDGTYTLSGTSISEARIVLAGNIIKNKLSKNLPLKLLGGISNNVCVAYVNLNDNDKNIVDKGTGGAIINEVINNGLLCIIVKAGETLPNIFVKPMLTTNLNATYDDFVPYTGSTGQINSDVADIQSALDGKAASSHTHTKSQITDFPSSLPANGGNASTVNGHTVESNVPSGAKFTDTTYTSKSAVSGGTDVSLVTTGEKATWNAKTSNAGTITGIKMNGTSKGTSGVVDLGTVLTGGSQTSTSDEDGGENVYTFSDGSTITIKNGTKGDAGTGGSNRLTYYETRPTSANKASSSDRVGSIEAFVASSKMTTGKPSADAKILQMNWDNTSGWDSQLAMLNDGTLQHRSMSNGTWKNWKTVLDNNTGTWTPRIFDTASNEVRVGAAFGRYYVLGDMVFIDAILGIDGSCVCHHISGLPYVPDENRPSTVYPIRIASLSMGTNSPFNYIRGGDSWYVQNMAYASKDISDTWYVSGWYKKA